MNKDKNVSRLKNLVLSALLAALICVATAFIKFNTGINNGYVHVGDSIIYLAACLLPVPNAMISAAVGAAFADVLAGAAIWAPFTAVIKALNALTVYLFYTMRSNVKKDRILSPLTAGGAAVSGLVTVFGYLLAEGLLYSFPTALTSVPFSIIQAVGSLVIFIIIGAALDKANFKKRIIK